ncbi:ABC transporter substrate-binding protein [Donghicola sp. B5-SW-15]|uniref:ABC transporter substrate-binding protein n=2 Tax=Donghicola mangrovi TaxID=2729614 RepID=A0A850QAJ4_9RHOB|nr:extracellular solute-binding protein [Donghicola mangrovi]NVO22951.1 ABC transporter substrate-binding protein [Donghicola mangrovi]
MYGEPALSAGFESLPYVNVDAPKGGRVVMGETGSFDSLNPHQAKGSTPWQLRFVAYESLMGRNWDEPFGLYGLIAETIETAPDRSWVEFTLRDGVTFSDGTPLTVEDVMWSYETLGTIGHPRYLGTWSKVAKMEQTGDRKIKFTFNTDNPELALLIGMRPILKKAQFADVPFDQAGISVIPITTAPYVIDSYEAGRYVSLKRNENYWGKDLPLRRGTNNADELRMEFYGDESVMFEAFKAGELNAFRESNGQKWDTVYDFPAVQRGDVVKSEIPHQRPSGITGLAMNIRKAPFDDWRVREAMMLAFNFEFINTALNGGKQQRITSYFSNSMLSMDHGPATGKVLDYLNKYQDALLPGAVDGYDLPVSDGSERNRSNLRKAAALLEEAGWTVGPNGQLTDAEGAPFSFDILLRQGSSEVQGISDIFIKHLESLGIKATVTVVDAAQYTQRTDAFDYDMTYYRRGVSLSPGNEQYLYWGSEAAGTQGSYNMIGIQSAAVDGLIGDILQAQSNDDFVAATKALDRVLTTGRYVIPFYEWNVSWIAHDKHLKYPSKLPIYGDWIDFMPDVWWWEE